MVAFQVLQGLESTDPPSSKPRVYNQGLFDIRPFSSVGILDPLTCVPKIWPRILRVLTKGPWEASCLITGYTTRNLK